MTNAVHYYQLRGDGELIDRGCFHNAMRPWTVPVLEKCPACGRRGFATGRVFPEMDLGNFPQAAIIARTPDSPIAVSWDRLCEIRTSLAGVVPPELIVPGVEFGSLAGKTRGRPVELCFDGIGIGFIIDAGVVEALTSAGLRLPVAVPCDVVSGSSKWALPWKYVELSSPYYDVLAPASYSRYTPCSACGLGGTVLAKRRVLYRRKVANVQLDIFRAEAGWITIVTSRFKSEYERLKLRGAYFEPLLVVD